MSKKTSLPADVEPVEEPTSASFHFREKGNVQPVGYEGLGIEEPVTVIIEGKVLQIGANSWAPKDKRVEVEIKSCKFVQPIKKTSMDDAIADAGKSRKKV